jgi:hypothetical protein
MKPICLSKLIFDKFVNIHEQSFLWQELLEKKFGHFDTCELSSHFQMFSYVGEIGLGFQG